MLWQSSQPPLIGFSIYVKKRFEVNGPFPFQASLTGSRMWHGLKEGMNRVTGTIDCVCLIDLQEWAV